MLALTIVPISMPARLYWSIGNSNNLECLENNMPAEHFPDFLFCFLSKIDHF